MNETEQPDRTAPSTWPTALGVINLILVAFGMLGGCCGLSTPISFPFFADMMRKGDVPEEQIQAFLASQPPVVWTVGASLIGMALSVLLLVGSIKLLRRRAGGLTWIKTWAWINIPWSLVGFMVNLVLQLRIPPEVLEQQQGGPMGRTIGLAVGACFVLVLGIGYPLFTLLWFMRESVKAEVANWEAESRALI